MKNEHEDTRKILSASELSRLKDHLRTMDPSAIMYELTERNENAETKGEELDALIILAYYDVLDEVDPITVSKWAYQKSFARFKRDHPEFFPPETSAVKRFLSKLCHMLPWKR